ncbi:MAG: protoheme IX farnesyltransferase [Elusimicrobia bacterium]|nr:protoheme IX farnesyltransferase [Elusimicrobiota bacterium]
MTDFAEYNSTRHRLALVLVGSTLGLIFIGGLVTSTHSGLAVPDWPLSYGRLFPPMVGGILFEHGHRMVASLVGLLTIVTVFFFRRDPRAWLRRATWAALGLVIAQGVLGGLTVLLKLPKPISIAHGVMAQTFFCLTVALAVWTSPSWGKSGASPLPDSDVPLPHMALLLFLSLYVQLVLGAVVRHTGHAIAFHVVNAGLIFLWMGWIFHRLTDHHTGDQTLWRTAVGIGAVYFLQASLGVGTLLSLTVSTWSLHPVSAVLWTTSHVMAGASLLGLSVAFLLLSWRRFPGVFSSGRVKDYVALTKPGISFMAAVTALAGFLLGSAGTLNGARLAHTALGTLLVSAGACALNMLLERDVDARMHRTESRPLPARRLYPGEALFLGVFLLSVGIVYLAGFVNGITAGVSGVTASIYLYVYTPLKKISALNTVFGAVAGALPPVMGWTAAAGRFEVGAWVLFGILFFWQFPHFFSLAWLYREDYERAGLTMLPVVEGDGKGTSHRIVATTVALLGASFLPLVFQSAGLVYGVSAGVLGTGLLGLGFLFLRDRTSLRARRLFLASVVYLPVLLAVLVFDAVRRGA